MKVRVDVRARVWTHAQHHRDHYHYGHRHLRAIVRVKGQG